MAIVGVSSECPKNSAIPVMKSDTEFYCAYAWNEWGDTNEINACNGIEDRWIDNEDLNAAHGSMYPMGSIIVKAGCRMYSYEDYDFTGNLMSYYGPATYPDACIDHECPRLEDENADHANGFHSLRCRCDQEPIICEPTDSWQLIAECDNSGNPNRVKCPYKQTTGTKFDSTAQESMSIDPTIEEEMKARFFDMFGREVGHTPIYDWTEISEQAKGEIQSFDSTAWVHGDQILQIYEAEGKCGGNNIMTGKTNFVVSDSDGKILSKTLDFIFPN